MTKSTWRELVAIDATYYKAGDHPWQHFVAEKNDMFHNAGDVIYSEYSHDEIAANEDLHADDWWGDNSLWWFDGVGKYSGMERAELPGVDAAFHLECDAVHFTITSPHGPNSSDDDDYGGLLRYEVENAGLRETFIDHADDMKRLIDLVRKSDHRLVKALIVFECEAGQEPSTCDGPGEYYSNWWPIGLLDLDTLTITALPE